MECFSTAVLNSGQWGWKMESVPVASASASAAASSASKNWLGTAALSLSSVEEAEQLEELLGKETATELSSPVFLFFTAAAAAAFRR
jgi:hypothetical protein